MQPTLHNSPHLHLHQPCMFAQKRDIGAHIVPQAYEEKYHYNEVVHQSPQFPPLWAELYTCTFWCFVPFGGWQRLMHQSGWDRLCTLTPKRHWARSRKTSQLIQGCGFHDWNEIWTRDFLVCRSVSWPQACCKDKNCCLQATPFSWESGTPRTAMHLGTSSSSPQTTGMD